MIAPCWKQNLQVLKLNHHKHKYYGNQIYKIQPLKITYYILLEHKILTVQKICFGILNSSRKVTFKIYP